MLFGDISCPGNSIILQSNPGFSICPILSDGTDGISRVSRSVMETGDDEEDRDEVLAVSITPGVV